jgi:putative SOS response-associated peptidase YedK
VTTAANKALSNLHDRMPVILAPGDYAAWLDPSLQDPTTLQHMLQPYSDDELIAEPVGTRVNRVANDDPQCIAVERSLF